MPETLVPACQELEAAFREAWADQSFRDELDGLLADYAGRPSPITECHRLSAELGVRVLLKREDMQPVFSFKACSPPLYSIANASICRFRRRALA